MEILRRVFTTIVPWYNEDSETSKDKKYHGICSSANSAITKAQVVIDEYQSSSLFLINHGNNGRIKKG